MHARTSVLSNTSLTLSESQSVKLWWVHVPLFFLTYTVHPRLFTSFLLLQRWWPSAFVKSLNCLARTDWAAFFFFFKVRSAQQTVTMLNGGHSNCSSSSRLQAFLCHVHNQFSNKCRGQLRFPWHQWKSATDQTLVVVHFTLPCVVNYFCFTGNLEINWLLISLNKINVFNSMALCCCSKSLIFDNVTLCDTCCNEGIQKIHVHLLKKHFPKMFCCLEFILLWSGFVESSSTLFMENEEHDGSKATLPHPSRSLWVM